MIDLGTVLEVGARTRRQRGTRPSLWTVQVTSTSEGQHRNSHTVRRWNLQVARLQVLESEEPTLLLGRSDMRNFGSVLFDWDRGKIRLGKSWIEIYSTAVGGDPLFRAQIAVKEEKLTSVAYTSVGFDIDSGLSREKYTEIEEICEVFSDRFAANPKKPECSHTEKHYIDTDKAPPIKVRSRRFPPGWEREIEVQVQEMLANGVCRPSKSPWASNVVLVRKRDGTLCFAIDYRKPNDVTKKDAYSLPDIQTILDKLKGSRYFTSLDVTSAYWCVPMHEEDVEKTAFHTLRGQFEMTVMPFGLCNSQATYQRLMDKTLQGLEHVQSFVDDCLIYSETFEGHVKDLDAVLERLRRANIQLRADKCHFAYKKVDILGHRISEEGRRPLEASKEIASVSSTPINAGVTRIPREYQLLPQLYPQNGSNCKPPLRLDQERGIVELDG